MRGKEEFTIGRSPDNDVVLYGEKFPKRLRMFVPTGSGYELRLFENSRGEVVYEKSSLTFSDLLLHDLLPRRNGCPILSITPGKSGYLILDEVRIDFYYDGADAEVLEFEGYSPVRAFARSLTRDPFFKLLVIFLITLQIGFLQWQSGIKITPANQADQLKLLQKAQKIAATFKPIADIRAKSGANAAKQTAESTAAETNRKKEQSNTERAHEKRGYGENASGEGVNLEKVGVLALIGGTGPSESGSDLMQTLIREDLAKGLNEVMAAGKNLSAGRGQAGSTADVNALLAYGMLGEGKGGNSSIEDILKNDVASSPTVKLQKTGKVSVEGIGAVSGSQEAIGARTEESLRQVLTQNMGRLQYIYNKYLKTNPEIGGKVEVEVTINADGTVANAVVLSSEIALPDFQREIVSTIRRWKYEAITQGQVKVVYPIVFVKIN